MGVDRSVKHFAVVDELPDGFVPASEIEEGSGIGRKTLSVWLVTNGFTRHTQAVVVKGYMGKTRALAVRADIAERYEQVWSVPRAASRPRGWPNRKQARARVGSEVYFRRAIQEGRIRGVKVGKQSYYHPEDLEPVRLEYIEATRARPGWEPLRALEKEAGVAKGYGSAWLRRYEDRIGLSLEAHTAVLSAPRGGRATYWSPDLARIWRARDRLPRYDPYRRVGCPICEVEVSRNNLPRHIQSHERRPDV